MSDGYPLAGRWRRLAATLIDAALVPALTIFLVMVAGVVEDAEDYTSNWWMLWVFLLAVGSYLILNGYGLWHHGQTLGKRLTGIAIVPATMQRSGLWAGQAAPFWKLIFIRAWFFPALILCLLVLNNRRDWIGAPNRNGPAANLALLVVLAFFSWVAFRSF